MRMPAEEKQTGKWISDIVGALFDPIIVYPGGWGDTLPEWVKSQITMERLIENMKPSIGEKPTGTDAEATAYLMSASLSQPMSSDWAQIYLHVAGKTMQKFNKVEVPADIQVETITDAQIKKLKDLKDWIYRTRVKHRQERDRAEKRQEKDAGQKPKVVQEKFF